jgi:hypothetical protein
MKTLTTFILGLILAFSGLFLMVCAKDNNYDSWWDYAYTIIGFALFYTAYNKIQKSTN